MSKSSASNISQVSANASGFSKLSIPRVSIAFAPPEEGDGVRRSSGDCGPPTVKVTLFGPWSTVKANAIKDAYTTVRTAAKAACEGSCGESKNCAYREDEIELLDGESRHLDGQSEEFRFKAKTTGGCQCE